MSYEIIRETQNSIGQDTVVVSNGEYYFVMTAFPDGTYVRRAGGGLTLQVRTDFDYAAIGAEKCKTLRTAMKWARA